MLAYLHDKEDPETGVALLKADNNKDVPVIVSSQSQGRSKSTISKNDRKVFQLLQAQGGDHRLDQFLTHQQVASRAAELLYIPQHLGAKEAAYFKLHNNLSYAQLGGIRSLGVRLPPDTEIREQERAQEIPLTRKVLKLEVTKARYREKHETVRARK